MNIIDENLTIINKNLDGKIHDMFQKLERKLKDTQNEHIQLPFDIIMKIIKMRPRDSHMKSPTADIMKRHIDSMSWNYMDDPSDPKGVIMIRGTFASLSLVSHK